MTKLIALLLSLLMLVALAGCSSAPKESDPEPLPPPPITEQPPEEIPPEPEPILQYFADTTLCADTVYSEDKIPLVTYSYSVPRLTVRREDGSEVTAAENAAEEQALTVAMTFNERFAEWVAAEEVEEWTKAASEQLSFYQEEGFPWNEGYCLELSCTVYQTEQMVSVYGMYYSYTGGAHPNTYHMSWNFDLETATFFDPKLLGKDADFQKVVADEILRQAHEIREDGWYSAEMYWDDHETIIADWSSYAVYFNEKGMTVTFSPYELAPYVAGVQEFFLSYDLISPYLSEDGQALLGLITE